MILISTPGARASSATPGGGACRQRFAWALRAGRQERPCSATPLPCSASRTFFVTATSQPEAPMGDGSPGEAFSKHPCACTGLLESGRQDGPTWTRLVGDGQLDTSLFGGKCKLDMHGFKLSGGGVLRKTLHSLVGRRRPREHHLRTDPGPRRTAHGDQQTERRARGPAPAPPTRMIMDQLPAIPADLPLGVASQVGPLLQATRVRTRPAPRPPRHAASARRLPAG